MDIFVDYTYPASLESPEEEPTLITFIVPFFIVRGVTWMVDEAKAFFFSIAVVALFFYRPQKTSGDPVELMFLFSSSEYGSRQWGDLLFADNKIIGRYISLWGICSSLA